MIRKCKNLPKNNLLINKFKKDSNKIIRKKHKYLLIDNVFVMYTKFNENICRKLLCLLRDNFTYIIITY